MAEEVIVGNKVVMKVILLIGQTLSELRYVEIDTTAHIAWRARPGHREDRMGGRMLGKKSMVHQNEWCLLGRTPHEGVPPIFTLLRVYTHTGGSGGRSPPSKMSQKRVGV